MGCSFFASFAVLAADVRSLYDGILFLAGYIRYN